MGRSSSRRRRWGVSLVDILVMIVLVGLLVALWVPTVGKTRERSRRHMCMNHLYVSWNALQSYRGAWNSWPRVIYAPGAKPDVSNTGFDAPDPFKAGGPPPNNVPAALFLLLRTQQMDPTYLICPTAGARFQADRFGEAEDGPFSRSNFTDLKKNLGYSYFVPYTEWANKSMGNGHPLMADLNPGTSTQAIATTVPVESRAAGQPSQPLEELKRQNSNNHEKRGQMVLFDDGSVMWFVTPFAGFNADNIYSTHKGTVVDTPARLEDAILLPAEK